MKPLVIKQIFKSYQKLLISTAKILSLVLCCIAAGLAIVYPLWKWAKVSPETYTWSMIFIFTLVLLVILVRSVKKRGGRLWLTRFLKLFLLFSGISGMIALVFHGNRAGAIVTFIVMFFLYGLISVGLKKK